MAEFGKRPTAGYDKLMDEAKTDPTKNNTDKPEDLYQDYQAPATAKTEPAVKASWKEKLKKKWPRYIALPLAIILLFLVGLYQQGYIGPKATKVSAKLIVTDSSSAPIEGVQALIGESNSSTDTQGQVTLTALKKGAQTLILRKTGFIEKSASITLKKGENDLGTFVLEASPATKVDLSLSLLDYIQETALSDASLSLNDLKPILGGDKTWLFSQVPVGSYKLTISRSGYNTYSADIEVKEDSQKLDPIMLVPKGLIVFESNRDKGLRGVYTANYDGSDQKQLVKRVGDFEDYNPLLDPTQKRVVFTSNRDGLKIEGSTDYKTALYLVNVDGSSLNKIYEDADNYSSLWAANGNIFGFRTRYTSDKGNLLKLYNVSKKQLYGFDTIKNLDGFAFSTDSNYVAFSAADATTSQTGVYLAKTDATDLKTIDSPGTNSYYLEITADNKVRYSYYDNIAKKSRYFEYNISSGEKTEISPPTNDRLGAIISPNKKLKAYVSNRDGKSNLFIADADGKNEKQLTTLNKVSSYNLIWSLDSSFILLTNSSTDESARYLVSVNSQAKAKKITDIYMGYGG